MAPANDNYRIDKQTAISMVVVAILFDLISIVPGLNVVSLVLGNLTFGLWFKMKGVGLIGKKKIATWGGEGIIEAIPALSALPGITVGVILMLVITRTEDATVITVPQPTKNNRIGDIHKKSIVSNDNVSKKKTRIPQERFKEAA
jgi:hypothetical protein